MSSVTFDTDAARKLAGSWGRRLAQKLAPGKRDPHGEPEGVVGSPKQLDQHYHASTVILCKDIADLLVKRYPGWSWAVQPDDRGGIINIFNLHLHPEYGYTIRMVDIQNDPSRRCAIAGGHEILRRFRMPDRMDPHQLAEAPRDMHGNCIPDISDLPNRKARLRSEIAMGLATGKMKIVEHEGRRYLKVDNR